MLGAESCMWGERVDQANIIPMIFPRVAGMAELLWTSDTIPKLPIYARDRLSEWECRANWRGISAAPTDPGFCNPLWSK